MPGMKTRTHNPGASRGVRKWTLTGLMLVLSLHAGATSSQPGPTGVYCLLKAYSPKTAPHIRSARFWENPAVDGVRLRTGWVMIQQSSNTYDWSTIDGVFDMAQAHGKSVGLSVAAGIASPEWVFENGVRRFEFTRRGRHKELETRTSPLPWDHRFLEIWGTFVRALAERYDDHPALAYVVIGGPGSLIETHFVRKRTDLSLFNSAGGIESWIEGTKRIIDLYAAEFEKTPFILTLGNPTGGYERLLEAVPEPASDL